jgi:hypothetical protein
MTLRMNNSWVLCGIVALSALAVDGSGAQAGAIIAKNGMTTPVGDPMFDYVVHLDLTARSILSTGGFITIYDFPFLVNPLTSQPAQWSDTIQNVGSHPDGTDPVGSPPHTDNPLIPNVTWIYNGPTIKNSTDADIPLGSGTDFNFIIGHTEELNAPPSPTLLFIGSLDGTNFSNLGFVTFNAVPEPSSVALLLVGVSTLPLVCLRNQKRATDLAVQRPA